MSLSNVMQFIKEQEVSDNFINEINKQIHQKILITTSNPFELSIHLQKEVNIIIQNYSDIDSVAVNSILCKIAAMICLYFSANNSININIGLFSHNSKEIAMPSFLAVTRIQAFLNHIFEASIKKNNVERELSLIFDLCYHSYKS